jgi:hypothetical protein
MLRICCVMGADMSTDFVVVHMGSLVEDVRVQPNSPVCVYKAGAVPATYNQGEHCLGWQYASNCKANSAITGGIISQTARFGPVGIKLPNGTLGVSSRVIIQPTRGWKGGPLQQGHHNYEVVVWSSPGWKTAVHRQPFTAAGEVVEVDMVGQSSIPSCWTGT